MNRLAHLRKTLKKDGNLKKHFTQTGFAKLLGCSASLIRYLEQNDLPPSPALAASIREKLGIDSSWFSAPGGQEDAVMIAAVIERIKSSENREKLDSISSAEVLLPSFKVQGMIAAAMSATFAALSEDLDRGDHGFLDSLHELLGAREQRLGVRGLTKPIASPTQLTQGLAPQSVPPMAGVESA